MSDNFSIALAPALVILMIGLSMGSCAYLTEAGQARRIEANAAMIAAERCQPREPLR